MQPILFERYRDIICEHGASAAKMLSTLVDSDDGHQVFYVPFESVNREARLVVVGITPGPTQIELTYNIAQRMLTTGATAESILATVKREATFGGPSMRPNLLRMLNAFDFAGLLGIDDVSSLWEASSRLLHATSVVPHAAFKGLKPFAGGFDEILSSAALRTGFERDFIPSLSSLGPDARYVGLGPTPLDALNWCAARSYLREDQILGAFAHPSSKSGSQVDVYLGLRDSASLNKKDPVRSRVDWLLNAASRVRKTTDHWGGRKDYGVKPVNTPLL